MHKLLFVPCIIGIQAGMNKPAKNTLQLQKEKQQEAKQWVSL